MIYLLLADDHPIMRQGLRGVFANEPDLTLVGEAGTGLEAIRLAEKLQPHVLVLDLMIPDLNGLEVTRQVHQRWPRIGIVMLSMQADESYVAQAFKHGARGYVLKDAPAACLLEGIRTVYAGGRYLSPPLSERALELYARAAASDSGDPVEALTTREREVLQLTAEGRTSHEIAERLHISPRTVENHRTNLMTKLGLNNQSEVIRFALRHGLLPLDR